MIKEEDFYLLNLIWIPFDLIAEKILQFIDFASALSFNLNHHHLVRSQEAII